MIVPVKRLGLLLILGACLRPAALSAQPPAPIQDSQVMQVNGNVVVTPPEPAPEAPRFRPLQRILNPRGMSCTGDFNAYGCGNFWSEFAFVFGSCRTFFGQTCTPNNSHNGAGTGPGGGANVGYTAYGYQGGCANGSCGR